MPLHLEQVCGCRIADVDLGSGTVTCELEFREGLFYQILSERTGFSVENDGQLLRLLTELITFILNSAQLFLLFIKLLSIANRINSSNR